MRSPGKWVEEGAVPGNLGGWSRGVPALPCTRACCRPRPPSAIRRHSQRFTAEPWCLVLTWVGEHLEGGNPPAVGSLGDCMKWAGLLCRLRGTSGGGNTDCNGTGAVQLRGRGGGPHSQVSKEFGLHSKDCMAPKEAVWCQLRSAQMRALESSRAGTCGWENWSGGKGEG